ncbi:type VI secretion system Vgr family protein [Thalassococcus sp. S3]|uniref:type VI secretion system Vgr family protein n=1 Tax=Thalassococcus sp. S3 TaxID=2017482 RepID=UPI0010242E3B|nr:type VI secretion system tip protein TssI/VgrG [Thalassococcus sp. S3]QBF33985.1 hypothetical protein CFI11_22655 [Thalassococcus sp. S3]
MSSQSRTPRPSAPKTLHMSKVAEDLLRANRYATLTAAPFPLDGVSLRSLRGGDRLGEPFCYEVKFVTRKPVRDFGRMPGQSMTVGMMMADRRSVRFFNGIITSMRYVGLQQTRRPHYVAELRPWLSLLGYRRNSRIFHDKTSLDILSTIFGEHGGLYTVKVRGALPRRKICTQYDETDLAFVSRLMEQDGLYYYFQHEEKRHRMVLVSDPGDHMPCMPDVVPTHLNLRDYRYKTDSIWEWREAVSMTSGRVSLKDYDHEKPKAPLTALEPVPKVQLGDIRETEARIQPGGAGSQAAGVTSSWTEPKPDAFYENFTFPARFESRSDGAFYARIRAQEQASRAYRIEVDGSMRQVTTGSTFRANNPYDLPDNSDEQTSQQQFLALGQQIELSSEVGDVEAEDETRFLYRATVEAQIASTKFRPERRTPWPRIHGPQTALVIGPDTVATDRWGRVRVRFHWDRDDQNSTWIRVAQPWAGRTFGSLVLPRKGQEVVVMFHDGNPDWPIVTGAVYNDDNRPPEPLPARATRSVFRSQSVPGRAADHNELSFEDDAGKEEVLLKALKDHNLKVGKIYRVNVGEKYALSASARGNPTSSFLEVKPDCVRLAVHGPTGPQGIEIGPEGVSIIGSNVGLMSRMGPVSATPMPVPTPTPQLTKSAGSIAVAPFDAKIKD